MFNRSVERPLPHALPRTPCPARPAPRPAPHALARGAGAGQGVAPARKAVDAAAPAGLNRSMSDPLDTVFSALADPTRRAILMMLLEDDMAVTDVAEPFEMSLAAISKHLGILSRAGLITQEQRGRVKWCKLQPDALRDASIWMQSFGQFEAVHLEAFERFLARELSDGETEA